MNGVLPEAAVPVLMAAALAVVTFAVVVSNYRAFPGLVRPRSTRATGLAVLGAAVAGALTGQGATGTRLWDTFVNAGIVALVAQMAARSDRRALLGAAGLAMLLAASAPVVGVALGMALAVEVLGVRLLLLKTVAGALIGAALTRELWTDPRLSALAVLTAAVAVLATSAWRRAGHDGRVHSLLVAGGVGAVLTVAIAGFLAAGLAAKGPVERGVALARRGLDAAQAGDASAAVQHLETAAAEFRAADARLRSFSARMADAVPGVAQNAVALRTMASVGAGLSRAGAQAAADGDPDALRIDHGALDLAQVDVVAGRVEEVVGQLTDGRAGLRAVQSGWLAPPLRRAAADLEERIIAAAGPAHRARAVLRVLPAMFGADGPRTWFVALQTPAETRASGGIIGNYALLRTDRGVVTLVRTGRDLDLNVAGSPRDRELRAPREYLDRYERFDPARTWQNVNLSPDFPTVGQVIEALYPQSGGERVDGVIGIDPTALAALLRTTGPVHVKAWPVDITADNAEEILLHRQYLEFQNPERIDFLAQVTRAVFEKVTTGQSPGAGEMARALGPATRGRHLQLYAVAGQEQEMLAELGADGAMPHVVGDSLAVVTQNSSGNKIDWFLRRTEEYRVRYDPASAQVESTLDLLLDNQAPARGLPRYVIGSIGAQATDPGENRMYLSVYSPFELVGATIDGSPLAMEAEREVGRNVYSAFVTVGPASKARVHLALRGAIPSGGSYRLDVRRQPLPFPEDFSVRVESTGGPLHSPRGLRLEGPVAVQRGPALADGTFEVSADPAPPSDRR